MKRLISYIITSLLLIQGICNAQNWVDVGPVFGQGSLLGSISYRPYFLSSINDSILIASGNFPKIEDTILCNGVAFFQSDNWRGLPELGDRYVGGTAAVGPSSVLFDGDRIIYHIIEQDTDTIINETFPRYQFIKSFDGQFFDTLASLNSEIVYLDIFENSLYAFGWFSQIDGQACRGLAKYNGTSWDCLDPPFGFGAVPKINDIYLFDNKLWVGGNFQSQEDAPYSEIAYFDLADSTWNDLDNGIHRDTWSRIDVFQEYKGELYIGGVFRYDMGNAGHMIMSWNPQTQKFSDLGGGIFGENYAYSSLAQVQDMIVFEDELWVSGLFDWAGGIYHPSIAVWDGTNWCTFGDSIETRVWDMEIFQDELYILTDFINGDTINKVAKWIGGDFRDTCGTFPLWPHSVEETTTDNIKIYPNPTDKQLTVSTTATLKEIDIFNAQGALIHRYSRINALSFDIQLEGLPNGLYFLSIETREYTVTKKIFKTMY
jgi:hypothetical protein